MLLREGLDAFVFFGPFAFGFRGSLFGRTCPLAIAPRGLEPCSPAGPCPRLRQRTPPLTPRTSCQIWLQERCFDGSRIRCRPPRQESQTRVPDRAERPSLQGLPRAASR